MRTYVKCNQCDSHFDFTVGFEETMPCPSCGANDWDLNVPDEDKAELRHKVKLIEGKRKGKKPLRETTLKEEVFSETNEWRQIERIVDRGEDVYYEKITDIKTGKVIKEFYEPLSAHIGHGEDKKR